MTKKRTSSLSLRNIPIDSKRSEFSIPYTKKARTHRNVRANHYLF